MSCLVRRAARAALAVSVMLLAVFPVNSEEKNNSPASLKVGISSSAFFEQPEWRIRTATSLWAALVKSQADIQAEFKAVDTERLAPGLAKRDLDLAVFQGYEFAWARQQDARLRPLLIAVNDKPFLHAAFVVRQDAKAKKIADLQGHSVTVHKGRRSHVRLYFERSCQALGKEPKDFFSRIAVAGCAEEALDDVVDGTADAAVVDTIAVDSYQRRKPGRAAKLHELAQSPVFPDPVIGYRVGGVDQKTLERFREGIIGSDQSLSGRQLLNFFKLTGFAKMPDDYDKVLKEIAKAYPAPAKDPASTEDGASRPSVKRE
jgi:ABC-type phosphate/phosphonate transport system substrate-binding protein